MKKGTDLLRGILFPLLYYSKGSHVAMRGMHRVKEEHPCIILLYHRIVNDETEYLDKGPVVHHPVRDFEEEVRFLKRNCAIAGLDDTVGRIAEGKAFDRPTAVITFDDGYLDNYSLAFPILRKYEVPATVFLTTALIGSLGRTWPDEVEWALIRTKKKGLRWHQVLGAGEIDLRTARDKKRASIRIATALKELDDLCRREALRELFDVLGVREEKENGFEARMMLNWSEVEEMWKWGISFGAHSHTHPILSRMDRRAAQEEVLLSKQLIEEHLGCRVKHFAFPNGREQDFTDSLRDYCKEIGLESIATAVHGLNGGRNGDVMRLKRIGAKAPVWEMTGGILTEMFRWYASDAE